MFKRLSGKQTNEDGTIEYAPWPEKTDIYCWWCCHPFDTRPVPLPVRYDLKRNCFLARGIFCSWGCAKAFCVHSNSAHWPEHSELLYMLYRRTVPVAERSASGIRAAPPRTVLKIFGGDMTIEDFRNRSDALTDQSIGQTYTLDFRKVNDVQHVATQPTSMSAKPEPKLKTLNYDNLSKTKNEPLRLRRNKPLPGKTSNILEKVLGIKTAPETSNP